MKKTTPNTNTGKATPTIEKLLKKGKKNAKRLDTLAIETGLPSRTLKERIKQERLKGALILADTTGYYMPKSRQEINDFIVWIESTIKSRQKMLKAFKGALNVLEGQMEIDKKETGKAKRKRGRK